MATITENINRIKQAKEELRGAINAKGGTLADDAKLSEFKEAVENIKTGQDLGHYGVDFADKIAEGHPAFSHPLQEDVDYYNRVIESIISRECTEEDYLAGDKMVEFKTKIAWFPPSFTEQTTYSCYTNLQYLEIKANVTLENCVVYWMKILKEVHYMYNKITETSNIHTVEFPNQNHYLFGFTYNNGVQEMLLNGTTVVPSINNSFTYKFLKFVNEFKETAGTFINPKSKILNTFNITYLNHNLNLSSTSVFRLDSVKYILDNCIAGANGASYSLTLHEDVKEAFMAKCTDGDENYDAEYAATLAAANAKGLTIA